MKKKIQELENQILHHKELYYSGKAKISDESYDALEAELRKLAPKSPVLQIVGSVPSSSEKVAHNSKMLSLDKSYDLDKLFKWKGDYDLISTYKYDGSSCSLIYEDGVLSLAKTRGDGSYGENITAKALFIPHVPKRVNEKSHFEIRGEIYCTEAGFFHLSQAMQERKLEKPQSQRNIVAGILGRKENFDLAKHLHFCAFEILSNDIFFDFESEKMEFMKNLGFEIPDYYLCKTKEDLQEKINEAEEFMSCGDFLIDGLVFTINNVNVHAELGETAHHPRYKLAFKFQGATKETKINAITWQVSRNGILTPVAEVEPVEVSQAIVSRVTLHNYGQVLANELKPGDTIEIVRSGEVIPKYLRTVKKTKKKIEFPHECPSCHKKLKIDDIRLVCTNKLCPAQNVEAIRHYIAKIEIEDLSIKRLEEMLSQKLITDIPSLYDLTIEKLMTLDKVKEKLATKLFENIQNSKKVDLIKFLSALGITGGGAQKIEKIVEAGYDSIEKFVKLKVKDLVEIEGFAEKSSEDFISSFQEKKELVSKLQKKGLKIAKVKKSKNSSLKGQKFCITGTLDRKRSEVQKAIKDNGGDVVSSVTTKTNFLVTNDKESSSSKFQKAKELGIPIITEAKLYGMF